MPENVVLVAVNLGPEPRADSAGSPHTNVATSNPPDSLDRPARLSDVARLPFTQSGSISALTHSPYDAGVGPSERRGLARLKQRTVQAQARDVGRDLQVSYDMGDMISDMFRIVRDQSIKEGFVEITL